MVDRTDRLRPIKKSQMRPANRNGQTHDIRAEGEMIVIRLRAGDFFTVACGRAGVPMRTAREWLLSGKGGLGTVRHAHLCREEHVWFYEEVMLALAEVEGSAVDAWMGEIKQGNWQAARDFLARRFPKRWGPGEHREVHVRSSEPTEIQLVWGDEDQHTVHDARPDEGDDEDSPARLASQAEQRAAIDGDL